jgi:hypothetical protein
VRRLVIGLSEIDDALFHSGLQNSLCLSLGCYSAVELSQAAGAAVSSFEEQIYSLRSSWPTHASLSMHVSVNDDKIDLPLSPPFLVSTAMSVPPH